MRLRWAGWATVLLLAIAIPLFAQEQPSDSASPEPTPDGSAPVGEAISIPIPEASNEQLKSYETPELAGATYGGGSQAVDGVLPKPFVDYVATVRGIRQRISIFRNGLVVVELTGTAATAIRKRLMLPHDALENYEKFFSAKDLADVNSIDPESFPTHDAISFTIYDDGGKKVERHFPATMVLTQKIEQQRMVLQDLLRALAEDREITNRLVGYQPKLGDRLIADDQQVYKVTQLINGGDVVELTSERQPFRIYVAVKDLHQYFFATRPPKTNN